MMAYSILVALEDVRVIDVLLDRISDGVVPYHLANIEV